MRHPSPHCTSRPASSSPSKTAPQVVVVVRDAAGAELQLRKNRIQEIRRSTVALMPEGLERALSGDEFRDLLAFLQGLK